MTDGFDAASAMAEMLEFLTLEPGGSEGHWRGPKPSWPSDYPNLFGGLVIAQAIMAATRDVPEGSRLHSLHAYFLRPVGVGKSVDYRIDDLRVGRSFVARRLSASQDDKSVLDMTYSLTSDTGGYVYDLSPSSPVPAPEDLDAVPDPPGPWMAAWVGPSEIREDHTRDSTYRAWYRIPIELEDDVHLHTALIGFATDWTGTGGRPLHLEGDVQGMISLDHAVWFHRPARADQWLFYDVQSLTNAGGRGLVRGVMRNRQGEVVASLSQEMRLVPVED